MVTWKLLLIVRGRRGSELDDETNFFETRCPYKATAYDGHNSIDKRIASTELKPELYDKPRKTLGHNAMAKCLHI